MKRLFGNRQPGPYDAKLRKKKRNILFGVGGGILVLLTGFTAFQKISYARPCGGDPNNSLYTKAAEALKSKDQGSINKYLSQIKSHKNFEADINCLYPAFYVSVKDQDTYKAEHYYEAMVGVSKGRGNISKAYKQLGFESVYDAKKQLDKLVDSRAKNGNTTYF